MRIRHSNRAVRILGGFGVGLGFLGLAGQGTSYLRAQETLAAPQVEAAQVESISLADVISSDVPATFSQAALEELLPDSWNAWGLEVSNLFIELYEDEPGSDDVDRILDRLTVKRETLSKAISDPAYSMIRNRLTELRSQMDRNIALVEAVQDAIDSGAQVDPTAASAEAFHGLSSAVTAAKADLTNVNTGDQWTKFFHLDKLAAIAEAGMLTAEDRETLGLVQAQLTDLNLYSADQAKFVQRSSLSSLAKSIGDVAALPEPSADAQAATLNYLREIVQAVNQYDSASSAASAAKLRTALRNQAGTSAAGKLASAVQRQFLSDNFRATVSESLIQRLLSDSQAERSVINDCVFGARVVGDQWTATDLSVDLQPSMSSAKFRLNLNGTVTTNTRGITPQATVFTKGNHHFTASKNVNFDGYDFSSTSATVGVNANNQTYNAAARTNFPIIKGIIRNIAISKAQELKPRSDAMTAGKIRDEVTSRFDSEVADMLGEAEGKLDNNLYARLRGVGLYPERQSVNSTDTTLDLSARVMNGEEVAASPPPSIPFASNGLALQVHDSYMNNALNRMNFRGRTMSSDEVKQEFESFAEQVLGRDIEMGSNSSVIEPTAAEEGEEDLTDAKFIFDSEDPLRVRIAAGQLYLTITAGLQTAKETIDPQIIEIPLEVTQEGSKIMIRRGTISVRPVEAPRNRLRQIAQANVMRTKIRQTLPDREIKGTFDIAMENKTVPLSVSSVDLTDGWMTVRAQ